MKNKKSKPDSIKNVSEKISELSVAASAVSKIILALIFIVIAINAYFFLRNVTLGKFKDLAEFAEILCRWVIYAIMIFSVSRMFKKISEEGTPFRDYSVKCLKTVGFLFIINSCLPAYISGVITGITSSFKAADFSVSLDSIIVGAIFFLLANIFSYGCILQRESDETL